MLGTKEQRTEGMKRQAQELIEQAYDRGYKAGLVDNQTFHESMCEKCKNGLIEQGRNEAWEVVKKIAKMPTDESEPIFNKFGLHSIMECYTASEAIEKLKAWEQKKEKDDIHIGDEVVYYDDSEVKFIVTKVINNRISGINATGEFSNKNAIYWRKTGRTFPEIAQVLAKMKEGDDEE